MTQKEMKFTVMTLIMILVVGCSEAPTQNTPIELGGILILSGSGAVWGEAARNGIDLAINDINNEGGINGRNLTVTYQDDAGKPENTVKAFHELTQAKGITYIIGPSWTRNGMAIKPLIDNEIVISPSLGSRTFNEENDHIFNTRQHDHILAEKLGQHTYTKGSRTVAILSSSDPYSVEQANAFKQSFESLGGKVEIVLNPSADQKDVRSDIMKVKENKKIDSVIVTTGGLDLTWIYGKQLEDMNVALPVYSLTIDRKVITNCEQKCNGWVFLSAFTPNEAFAQRYKETYGRDIEIGADSAYDAVKMLAKAMQNAEALDTNSVAKELNAIENYNGESGNLTSDGEGGFTKNYVVREIQNGEPVTIN